MKSFAQLLWNLIWEFRFAIVFALAVTFLGGDWSGWAKFIAFWPVLVSAGWVVIQYQRIKSKASNDRKMADLADRLQKVTDNLRSAATDLEGRITGGDSLPYVWLYPPGDKFRPHLAVKGKHTQRSVTVTFKEVPLDDPATGAAWRFYIGDVIAGHHTTLENLPTELLDGQPGDARRLFITLQGLNGTTQQHLHLRKVDGEWRFAMRLMHGQMNFEYRQPGYPEQPNWIEDRQLSRVVLGGKPYDPLSDALANPRATPQVLAAG